MDALQTIITSVLAAGTAILASHLTNKANLERLDHQAKLDHEKERDKALREMREQIYHAIFNWTGTTTSRHVAFISLIQGRSTWDQYLEHTGNVKENPDIQVGIIEYRVNAYFPDLVPHWVTLMSAFRALAAVWVAYASAKNFGKENELNLHEPAKQAIDSFIKATDEFKKKILTSSAA
ncbi:hypothetical protein [Geothrix alkalitolerans]|uniref:hypothetical protein n=1 Tax=Geothrix alkalitolerans TaxID=2922724 RepID=UPI001FAF9803|nr:hypothetical protein [Geothrix alkalitolerans]